MKNLSKTIVLVFCCASVWLQSTWAYADTIVLKDSRRVEAEAYWEDGGTLKYQKHGAVVGIPLERIDRIEKNAVSKNGNVVDFGFDLWKMGTSIQEVMEIAERNDIPLGRSGLIHSNKHFNKKLCRPYIQTHSKFGYTQVILGYPANVSLTFTLESRNLALITVRFNISPYTPGQKPNGDVVELLHQKYGKPHRLSGDLLSKNNLEWRINKDNMIRLVSYSNSTTITYKNSFWYDQLENEKQHQADLKRQGNFEKDAGKF